jgi:superfamily II DNA/RNA helicase
MSDTFEKLGVSEPLAAALRKEGITVPTAIQTAVIPAALAGKDIIGQSATGTGKTLAYLLPLFQKIDTAKRENQAIILAPTHELAMQIQRRVELLAQNSSLPVTAMPVIGNVNIARQIDKLKEKPHIIAGSSGRILELIQKKKISAQTVRTIIIDEADRLLDDKNADGVKAVIKSTLMDRQLMMFSATMPPAALSTAQEWMREPEVITSAGQAQVPADISHMYFLTDQRDKIEVLRKLVTHLRITKALVFINRSDDVEMTVAKLAYHRLKAAGLHGASFKEERRKALEDFRSGRIELLVASDVAARGLDIPGVGYVINLDIPEEAQLYLHRVGRTGRAGQSGTAISIVTVREEVVINKFARLFKIEIPAKEIARGKVFDKRERNKSGSRAGRTNKRKPML